MNVTGIEISQTAIGLAREKMQLEILIYHGPVSAMPFDAKKYDGIFCHAVIHLLGEEERKKLIRDSYAQLSQGGSMIFTAVSTKSPSYGKGEKVGANRYEQHGGAKIFFYDEEAVRKEFRDYGLVEIREISEPGSGSEMPFFVPICSK